MSIFTSFTFSLLRVWRQFGRNGSQWRKWSRLLSISRCSKEEVTKQAEGGEKEMLSDIGAKELCNSRNECPLNLVFSQQSSVSVTASRNLVMYVCDNVLWLNVSLRKSPNTRRKHSVNLRQSENYRVWRSQGWQKLWERVLIPLNYQLWIINERLISID